MLLEEVPVPVPELLGLGISRRSTVPLAVFA